MKNAICMILMFALGYVGGFISGSREKKVIEKPVEVIKYVEVENNQPLDEQQTKKAENNPYSDDLVSIGTFKATAYCPCVKCCGKTPDNLLYGITASGKKAVAGRTIAADPNVLPLGTEIYISGDKYVVEDTGGAIKGRRIDIYYDNHEEALNFGRQDIELFVKNETK